MQDDPDSLKLQHAATWSRASITYSNVGPRFFQHFGSRLVTLTPIQPGDKVLDVAAGRGALLFPAAEKVGAKGEVVGVDYSEGMVAQTNAQIEALGLKNARMVRMDAERLEFAGSSFDCVLCGFAIFFFPQFDKALSEFRRVLRPGGSLAMSTWGPHDPRWNWLEGLGRTETTVPARRFDQPEAMKTLISDAGFSDIQVIEEQREVFFADEEEWWATNWSHGARIHLEKLTPDQLDQAKSYVSEKLQPIKQPDGIPLMQRVLFTLARKPK